MTQDGNNIKVKWWNAEIKGAHQVHQICYDAPKFFYWHQYSAALRCLVLQWRTESLKEGDMKQAGDGHGRTERVKLK